MDFAMFLLEYRPKQVGDMLEIRTTVRLSVEEHRLVTAATSPEVFFARAFRHDASLLPRDYALTRCWAEAHGDGIWKVMASAKRKPGVTRQLE